MFDTDLTEGETTEPTLFPWEQLASAGKPADAVVEYVRYYDWVTFVELERFEPYLPVKGDRAIHFETDPNLIVWPGMSSELTELICELLRDRRLFFHPTVPLTYMLDGGVPNLPVAKRLPQGGYRTPHWLPTCIRVVPQALDGKGRPKKQIR